MGHIGFYRDTIPGLGFKDFGLGLGCSSDVYST